ncbi:MAG TPA: DUF3040 domain-containing protein [Pseudonocardiaceae bacterium]|nr:DUF3040 domain-containing protein [Pseudonocardiaceae bacterium]
MGLTEHEKQALREIAYWLEREDGVMARKLRGRAWSNAAMEWRVIAPLALGLLVVRLGVSWHATLSVALGVVIAVVGPIAASIWLTTRRRSS